MPTVSLDGFVTHILRSGLLASEQLDPHTRHLASAPARPDADPVRELAVRLVKDRLLTTFQAKHLLAGKYRGFFFGGKYKVLAHLGSGGMGHVYLCEHLLLQRLVAVKRLAFGAGGVGTKEAAERFLREARAVAALQHPNIVAIHDMDRDGDHPYLVMEYVDGNSLHEIVADHAPLSPGRAADCGRQAALGLQHAVEAGLIHRDVKPGNLLLDRGGGVRVLDLGLARFTADTARNANLTGRFQDAVVGTADYIAPEQANESALADHRSDQYALGGTLYYLLTGRPPFPDGTVSQKLLWHQIKEPVLVRDRRPEVPAGLAAAVHRMMAKDPAARFPSHRAVADVLTEWADPLARPPAEHMPAVPPTAYRLGVSPGPPDARAGGPISDTALTPSPGQAGMETAAGGSLPRPSPLSSSPLLPVQVVPAAPPTPTPWAVDASDEATARTVRPRRPGRRRALLAGAAGLSLLAVGLWAAGLFAPVQPSPPPVPSPAPAVELTAAGSTLIQPLMEHWADEYAAKAGVRVVYQGGGSGAGVKGVLAGKLAFGCTDAPLTDAELAATPGPVPHVPLAMGAVVPTYNLPTVSARLRFTGPLLANIYLGKITRWDDPAIQANNPGVRLPDLPITPVYRSDKSGTTNIWTQYLTATSGEWKGRFGVRSEIAQWPAGVGGKLSDGMAEAVSRTVGGIGYVELSYALKNGLPAGAVRNKAGRYVEPSLAGVTAAAAAQTSVPLDLRYSLVDAAGEASYPIAGTTWAVLPPGVPAAAVEFLWWATHDGQAALPALRYAPLPPELVALVETKLRPLRR